MLRIFDGMWQGCAGVFLGFNDDAAVKLSCYLGN
jgi:hypothetical protein